MGGARRRCRLGLYATQQCAAAGADDVDGQRVVRVAAAVVVAAVVVPGRLDHAKEAAGGIARLVGPRVKEELVGLAALRRAVAEFQVPQALDGDRCAIGVLQLAQVREGGRIINVDVAGPCHVADQDVVAVRAEVRRRLGDPPRVLQRALVGAVGGVVGREAHMLPPSVSNTSTAAATQVLKRSAKVT